MPAMNMAEITGDDLLRVLAALASPHRLRIIAALTGSRQNVSQLSRALGVSRSLLQVHLRKLEAAGLVSSSFEMTDAGRAMNLYEVQPFAINLTPQAIADVVTRSR